MHVTYDIKIALSFVKYFNQIIILIHYFCLILSIHINTANERTARHNLSGYKIVKGRAVF
jgi:hypothetical protein